MSIKPESANSNYISFQKISIPQKPSSEKSYKFQRLGHSYSDEGVIIKVK